MAERSDRMWSIGEGNGKSLQYSCLENAMNSMKRQNDRILKEGVTDLMDMSVSEHQELVMELVSTQPWLGEGFYSHK